MSKTALIILAATCAALLIGSAAMFHYLDMAALSDPSFPTCQRWEGRCNIRYTEGVIVASFGIVIGGLGMVGSFVKLFRSYCRTRQHC